MFNVLMILCIVLYVLLAVGLIALSIRFNKIIFVIAFVILEFLVLALNRGTLYSQGGSGMLYPIIFLCYIVITTVFVIWTVLAVKHYKIKTLIPVAIFALTIIIQIAVFNYSIYGWFYSFEKSMIRQYPEVRSMQLYERYPSIGITYYIKSTNKNEMNGILNSTKRTLLNSKYKSQIDDTYCRLNNDLLYTIITVDFDVNGDSKIDIQCESDLSGDTWSDWAWLTY